MKAICDKTHEWLMRWGSDTSVWRSALMGFVIGLVWAYCMVDLILGHLK
jgi:hypothetical protein